MQDLNKVNATQLFYFWKNFSIGLLVMIVTLVLSKILPFYFSPIVGLVAAAFLYTLLYNNRVSILSTCMVVPYSIFYCVIVYSFVSIILNVVDIWNIISIPKELSFFNYPYIPALILDPVCLFTLLVFYLRRNRLTICIDCKVSKGLSMERGKLGEIISAESRLQLVNMIWLFAVLSVIMWVYYLIWYCQNAIVNGKDWYVFVWLNVIAIILDEIYFAARYYNIYLDLKDSGEIITEEELNDMTTKTYIRYYVICGNNIFLNNHEADPFVENRFVIDTPFVTKRNVNGMTTAEVLGIIQRMCGIKSGSLKFFFGRKMELSKHRVLRYFYYLDGDVDNYPDMNVNGEWVNFEEVKIVYNEMPQLMARPLLIDLSRLITIVLTQKLFDSRGYRKLKLKSYQPTISLTEVRDGDYDFQDDKWIRISMYNSDTRGFQWRKWFNKLSMMTGSKSGSKKRKRGGC